MKQIFIHIGMPKTGSSALQRFFLKNRITLEERGVGFYVPEDTEPGTMKGNASFLLKKIRQEADGTEDADALSDFLRQKNEFGNYAKAYDKLILTEELFWMRSHAGSGFWMQLRDHIAGCTPDGCRIFPVVYLRRQDEWVLSMWKQFKRSVRPDTRTPAELTERIEKLGLMDYYKRLQEVEAAFGRENMIVSPFDRKRFPNGDICRDFLRAASIPWSDDLISVNKTTNPSLTLDAAQAMHLINTGAVAYKGDGDSLRVNLRSAAVAFSLMYPEKTNMHFLDPAERQALLVRYAGGNQAVSEKYLEEEPLFDKEIAPYEVWRPDPDRDRQNAGLIIKLSRASHQSREWIARHALPFQ